MARCLLSLLAFSLPAFSLPIPVADFARSPTVFTSPQVLRRVGMTLRTVSQRTSDDLNALSTSTPVRDRVNDFHMGKLITSAVMTGSTRAKSLAKRKVVT